MTTDPDEEQDKIASLTQAARALAREISEIDTNAGAQLVRLTRRVRINWLFTLIMAASVVLDLALTVMMGFGFVSLNNNGDRITKITERLDVAQTVQRQSALCPLYQLFLDSRSDRARDAYPKGPEEYDRNFAVIRDGYVALGCSEFSENPPASGSKENR